MTQARLLRPHLRQYVAVAEELHFRRAAERLNMAQPPLSQAIRQLEDLVGATLLERSRQGARLTAAGAIFLDHARAMLAQEERAIEAARLTAEGIVGRLTLGFVGSVSYELLPGLLQAFRVRCPQVRLDLREQTSKEQVQSLHAGEVDAGLLRLPINDAADLRTRVLHRERFVAVLPRRHRLARAASVRLAQLKDESFMIFPADRIPSLHAKFMFACADAGFSPRVVLEAWQMPSMVGLVAAGFGVALLPSQITAMPHRGVVFKRISDASPQLDLEIAVGWRPDNASAGLKSFLALMDELAPASLTLAGTPARNPARKAKA